MDKNKSKTIQEEIVVSFTQKMLVESLVAAEDAELISEIMNGNTSAEKIAEMLHEVLNRGATNENS